MSTNKFLAKLQEIQKREGNKRCIDCNAPNPQWASVPFGILFCLECSGKHRSLGVHISFVRSITMDKWSEQQVKKMDLGGNKKALDFFSESPEYSEGMSIEDKYSSQFAQNYREKLAAECEGKVWTPSVSSVDSSNISDVSGPSTPKKSSNFSAASPTFQRSTSSGSTGNRSSSAPNSRRGKGSALGTPKSTGSPRKTDSPSGRNEEYFARLGEANDCRPDDLPPNQGGKYSGFGNTPTSNASNPSPTSSVPDIGDLLVDPVGTLSKGWSLFTLGASSAIGQAAESARNLNSSVLRPATEHLTENVFRPASETVRDPEFQGRVSGYVSSLSRTVQDTGSKGFSFLSEYLQSAPSPGSSRHYDAVNHEEEEADGWGYGDEKDDDYAAFGKDPSEKFKSYQDEPEEEEQEESTDAWKSSDVPVSGASSSTKYGASALASKKGSTGNTLQRKTRNTKTKSNDDWGEDEDEWSKF